MILEDVFLTLGGDVPDANSLVGGTGRQVTVVRAEAGRDNPSTVAVEA